MTKEDKIKQEQDLIWFGQSFTERTIDCNGNVTDRRIDPVNLRIAKRGNIKQTKI